LGVDFFLVTRFGFALVSGAGFAATRAFAARGWAGVARRRFGTGVSAPFCSASSG
jgi:hypothetical protein